MALEPEVRTIQPNKIDGGRKRANTYGSYYERSTSFLDSSEDEMQNFVSRSNQDGYNRIPSYASINQSENQEVLDDLETSGSAKSIRSDSTLYTRSIFTPSMEDRLRRRLRFHFMNPCEKWKSRRRFPWKLILQLLKVFLVTLQLVLFGHSRSRHVEFLEKNVVTFKHLYLYGWEPTYETMPYPPASGPFAVYTNDKIRKGINYAWYRYNQTKQIAIGSYDFTDENTPPIDLYVKHYKTGIINPSNQTYELDSRIKYDHFQLTPLQRFNKTSGKTEDYFDLDDFFASKNYSINSDALIEIHLKFSLKTIHLKALSKFNSPDCFQFDISIIYDNIEHDGQVTVKLTSEIYHLTCHGHVEHDTIDPSANTTGILILDIVVLIMSILSGVLCVRSLFRAEMLRRFTNKFFVYRFNKNLDFDDNMEFVNLWHILMIVNDTLTITGTAFKMAIDVKHSGSYDECGLLLGTGNLLIWIGVLRYLQFFQHYNLLILTMKAAFPAIMRFVVCASFFYLGFTFCGWVVLGPYHVKFRDLGSASECLFSLVNGDDMFVTFATIQRNSHNTAIYLYSRVYLYIFISLFMYIVYSVFTSIIITTYETIKNYYTVGFPETALHEFINQDPISVNSPLYRQDSDHQCHCGLFTCCFNFCCKSKSEFPDEYTSL